MTPPDRLVSVVVPVHNRPGLLVEAVGSAFAQTHRPLEVLVVDDASTDETPAAIRELADRHPEVRAFRHASQRGPGAARETAREALRGAFVQWLDSDDLLVPTKFERQVAALEARPDCDVAYGRAALLWDGRPPVLQERPVVDRSMPAMVAGRLWETVVPLYRRRAVDRAGPWLPLSNEEDWEYDCRVAALGGGVVFVDEVVGYHRHHSAPRLSRGGTRNPRKLRDRAVAHRAILGHARAAGVDPRCPEMRRFERALFLLSRQCAAAGLADDARSLFAAARSVSAEPERADYRWFGAVARRLGWRVPGILARESDRLRELWRSMR